MSDERMIQALGRLEEALLRAEAAGEALSRAAATGASARESLRDELGRLESRHQRLRTSAASAIERLDGLIAPAAAQGSHHG